MSGVYIKGMQMPESCCYCELNRGRKDGFIACSILGLAARYSNIEGDKLLECPIIPIPDHGRLIDADAFIKQQTEQICKNCDRRRGMKDGKLTERFVYAIGDAPCRACDTGDMIDYLDDAPAIIPADKEGEG